MPPEVDGPAAAALAAGRMQRFAADLLGAAGALVEASGPETLDVLAPPPVQEALGVPELSRLGFGVRVASGAHRVGLEADWLERFARLLGGRGRAARCVLTPSFRPPADPERALAHALPLENATYRLLEAASAWTYLLFFEFRFTAIADEKREGLLRLALNSATGALIDDPPALEPVSPDPPPGPPLDPSRDLPAVEDRARLLALLSRALPPRLDAALAPFLEGLNRRLGRDQDRLHGFHNDLHREAARRLGALPEADPARRREEARIAAIVREYQARLEDLARQYALNVALAWTQTLEVVLPVHRLTVQLRRRKADRMLRLDWNPLTRRLDPPPCEWSRGRAPPRLVCDEALHLLCPAGLAPCAACGRPFCRACHEAACPKCTAPVTAPPTLPLARAPALH